MCVCVWGMWCMSVLVWVWVCVCVYVVYECMGVKDKYGDDHKNKKDNQ